MFKLIRTFAKDESGATAMENSLSTMFNTVSSSLSSAAG